MPETNNRDRFLSPEYRKAIRSTTVQRASFKWQDPNPTFVGSPGRRPGETVRGDQINNAFAMLLAASAQAKGWETSVSWLKPRSRDRITVAPFLSPDAALDWIRALCADRFMGPEAQKVLAHTEQYRNQHGTPVNSDAPHHTD